MIPTRTLEVTVRELLATDDTMLADPLDAPLVTLIAAPFTPSSDTDLGDLTPATFNGSTPKSATAGDQQAFYDPVLGVDVVQLLEPAGGWTWECAVAPASQETIYGYAVTNQAGTTTYGSDVFDTPVAIIDAGDAVSIPAVRLNIPTGSIT